MRRCVFCRILAGEVSASFVYEDANTAAFLSLEQPNPHKVLVTLREHVQTLYDLSGEQAAALFQTVVRVANAVREVSGCEGLNLVQSNGRAGQQDVFHIHVHLVPRWSGDGITLEWDNTLASRAELENRAAELRSFFEP